MKFPILGYSDFVGSMNPNLGPGRLSSTSLSTDVCDLNAHVRSSSGQQIVTSAYSPNLIFGEIGKLNTMKILNSTDGYGQSLFWGGPGFPVSLPSLDLHMRNLLTALFSSDPGLSSSWANYMIDFETVETARDMTVNYNDSGWIDANDQLKWDAFRVTAGEKDIITYFLQMFAGAGSTSPSTAGLYGGNIGLDTGLPLTRPDSGGRRVIPSMTASAPFSSDWKGLIEGEIDSSSKRYFRQPPALHDPATWSTSNVFAQCPLTFDTNGDLILAPPKTLFTMHLHPNYEYGYVEGIQIDSTGRFYKYSTDVEYLGPCQINARLFPPHKASPIPDIPYIKVSGVMANQEASFSMVTQNIASGIAIDCLVTDPTPKTVVVTPVFFDEDICMLFATDTTTGGHYDKLFNLTYHGTGTMGSATYEKELQFPIGGVTYSFVLRWRRRSATQETVMLNTPDRLGITEVGYFSHPESTSEALGVTPVAGASLVLTVGHISRDQVEVNTSLVMTRVVFD